MYENENQKVTDKPHENSGTIISVKFLDFSDLEHAKISLSSKE